MEIAEALAVANTKINEARRLYNIIDSVKFESAYNTVKEKEDVEAIRTMDKLVRDGRCEGLLIWIKQHRVLDFGELNIKELRAIASSYGVYKYYRKTKVELVQEVRYMLERPRLCKYCGKRHPEVACQDKDAEFDI